MRVLTQGLANIGCSHLGGDGCLASWSMLDANTGLAVLADSMHSYEGGGMAASLAVDTITEVALEQFAEGFYSRPSNSDFRRLIPILEIAGQEANLNIRRAKADYPEYQEMGTAILSVAVNQEHAIIVSAGNVGCYRISSDSQPAISRLTRADTLPQALLEQNPAAENPVNDILYRQLLTRALGPQPSVKFETQVVSLIPNNYLLLCSDGLFNALSEKEVLASLKKNWSLQEKADELIERSLKKRLKDSCCLILIQV